MIWATVSSQSCFCWLYRASPYLAIKNIINLVSVSTIWWCPGVESSLVLLEAGVCYEQWVLFAEHCGSAAERSYPTSKVRSSGCALLEQLWRDTPCPRWEKPNKMVGTERGHQRADRLKPQSQKTSQSDHRTTALSNSMKLSHAVWGHPRWEGHGGEFWQNMVHWRRERQSASVFLPWEPHEH